MMTALTFNQKLPRLTMPPPLLTRLSFTPRLLPITAQTRLQQLIIPIFPPTLVGNDDFLTMNGDYVTINGERITF